MQGAKVMAATGSVYPVEFDEQYQQYKYLFSLSYNHALCPLQRKNEDRHLNRFVLLIQSDP